MSAAGSFGWTFSPYLVVLFGGVSPIFGTWGQAGGNRSSRWALKVMLVQFYPVLFPDQAHYCCGSDACAPTIMEALGPYLPHNDGLKSLWNSDPKSVLPLLSSFSQAHLSQWQGKQLTQVQKPSHIYFVILVPEISRLTVATWSRLEIDFDWPGKKREQKSAFRPIYLYWRV